MDILQLAMVLAQFVLQLVRLVLLVLLIAQHVLMEILKHHLTLVQCVQLTAQHVLMQQNAKSVMMGFIRIPPIRLVWLVMLHVKYVMMAPLLAVLALMVISLKMQLALYVINLV